jgi:hypothetical protein
MLERHPLQELHGNVGLRLALADVVNCADVRMVQSGSRPCLASKTLQRLRVSGKLTCPWNPSLLRRSLLDERRAQYNFRCSRGCSFRRS